MFYYRYACSLRMLHLLRERGLGNSVAQNEKKLRELHSEEWYNRSVMLMSACVLFTKSTLVISSPPPCPNFPELPRAAWLLIIFVRDVFELMTEAKAKITSTYGAILKFDSTKKV